MWDGRLGCQPSERGQLLQRLFSTGDCLERHFLGCTSRSLPIQKQSRIILA